MRHAGNRRALRSSSSSSSSANGSAPIDASHLLYIESTSYPLTLSALLSSALALPVPAPDAPPFPAHEVREWSEKSEILRAKLEAGMERAAKEWLAVLEYLPPLSAGEPETVEGERERRTTYLCAALDELEAVTSRRPTRFVYLESSAFDDADLEREEERIREAERQERAKKDREFDEWVESIMGAAAASPADDAEEAKKKRTQMLDQPMGNGGETFRQALRTQWNAMYDSSSGGVLGNVAREFENIAAKYGGGSDEDQDTVGLPQPVQIMAAHHLRSQLVATLDALKPRDSRFAYNKKGEDDFLPPSMRGIMNLFQRSYTLRQATCQP